MTGPELRTMRQAAGLSLAEVARRMGRDRVTVWRWEQSATVDAARADRYRQALAAQ